MKNLEVTFVTISLIISNTIIFAQDQYKIKTTKLTDNIYQLNIDAGGMEVNTVVSVGVDGMLLVDTGLRQTTRVLKETLNSFEKGDPKIIINTHAHSDHTGGNAAFGRDPVIIAHEIVRTRVRSGGYVLFEYPDEALPDISFKNDLTVYFNGEEIKIIALPGAHDDNDAVVYFTQSNIVYTGDLFYAMMFPTWDGISGNTLYYAEAVGKLIELLPEDAVVIPGHGRLATMEELKSFHKMLIQTTEIVKREYSRGKDLAYMQEEKIIEQYDSFNYDLYMTTDGWIQGLYDAMKGVKPQKSYVEPLYHALKESDVRAAIRIYYDLKKNHFDEYKFSPGGFYYIGVNYLMEKERFEDAIKIFMLSLKEFPESQFNWAFYDAIGEAYMQNGNKRLAIKNYKKSLELNPDNAGAVKILKMLKANK